MPIGPEGDRERFEDFDECFDALSDEMPDEEARATCGKWQQEIHGNMKLYVNEVGGDVRRETLDGREYLVAPMTFIKSMDLHRGYVPGKEIEKAANAWKGRPIVPTHPTRDDGSLLSVNDAESDQPMFGFVEEPEVTEDQGDVVTQGEAWIDIERARELGGEPEEVVEALDAGRSVKVSAAYSGNMLPAGEYDGAHRDKVMGNLRPDHVSMGVNITPRCKPREGCLAGPMAANEVMAPMIADDSVSPENGQDEGSQGMKAANARQTARTPEYDDTESSDWSQVSKNLTDYVDAYEEFEGEIEDDINQVSDLPSDVKSWIASKTLLGDTNAESVGELIFFPVVNPNTNDLNENALDAVLSGRGAAADISGDQLESARSVARTLLEDDDLFGRDLSANAKSLVQRAANLVGLGEQTDDEPAESGADAKTESTMDNEKTELLVNEHGFDEENLPDESTQCFDRIYEQFAGNEEPDEEPEQNSTPEADEPEDEDNAVIEKLEQMEEQMVTVDELEDQVDEALAANQERQEKEEIAEEIVANTEDYEEVDSVIDDYPTRAALETKHDSVAEEESTSGDARFDATRGASPDSGGNAGNMPALSANERLKELESDD